MKEGGRWFRRGDRGRENATSTVRWFEYEYCTVRSCGNDPAHSTRTSTSTRSRARAGEARRPLGLGVP